LREPVTEALGPFEFRAAKGERLGYLLSVSGTIGSEGLIPSVHYPHPYRYACDEEARIDHVPNKKRARFRRR
jgi:hypothetical protein